MKIIAKTVQGFLLEATTLEIANLVGFYSDYENSFNRRGLDIGDEIKISEMFHQLYSLKKNLPLLSKTAAEFRNLADLLESKDPILRRRVEEVTDGGRNSRDEDTSPNRPFADKGGAA